MNYIKKMKTLSTCMIVLALVLSGCEGEGSTEGTTTSADVNTGGTGITGSTARMIIVDDYLYAIADNKIQLFDISTPSSPNPWVQVPVDWNIQTLFSYENYLLVGAADGIHILDNTDPSSPYLVGDFTHATVIDPVVASAGYAYVTLKNDPQANNGFNDQMNVISLADVTNPELVKVEPMQSPAGLSIVDQRLFVCDGIAGIKQFDISEPANPVFVDVIVQVDCNDVIAYSGILYAITDFTLLQYDYSVSPPSLMSVLETIEMSPDALTDLVSDQTSHQSGG